MRTKRPFVVETLTAIALIAVPFVLPHLGFAPTTINRILVWGVFGIGFDILFGFTGLLSFGQSAFFGTGGMVAAYLLTVANFPYVMLSLAIGMIVSAIVGYVIAAPAAAVVLGDWGADRVDFLVNMAGTSHTGAFGTVAEEDFDLVDPAVPAGQRRHRPGDVVGQHRDHPLDVAAAHRLHVLLDDLLHASIAQRSQGDLLTAVGEALVDDLAGTL